jgi:hypothetical protein
MLTGKLLLALVLGASATLVGAGSAAAGDLPDGDYWIVAGDQATTTLMAFDPADTDWNDTPAWSWKPAAPAYSAAEISAGTLIGDFKRRTRPDGTQRFVAASSHGLLTELTYPDKQRVWATTVPAADNPHAIEVLPNGNVAAAASTGGWVRVYAASQGNATTTYAEFKLDDAHAALWDPSIQRLWTIGNVAGGDTTPILTALEITGTAAAPKVHEDVSRRVTLPTAGGHDVYGDPTDPGRLLVTTNSGAYVFDKATRTFSTAPLGAAARSGVKAIGHEPSGLFAETRPDPACTADTWCTSHVDFFDGTSTFSRTRTGAQFYKARVWAPAYSVPDLPQRGKITEQERRPDGTWIGVSLPATPYDVSDARAAVDPAGGLHVFTVVPGSGVYERTGTGTVQRDTNGGITRVTAATTPDGLMHLFGVLPGSGVWERTTGAAAKLDSNPTITDASATTTPDGVLHVFTLVPGSGIWERTLTHGTWSTTAVQRDTNGAISTLASAAGPDGSLHLFGIVPGSGVWERTYANGTWATGATKIVASTDAGDVTAVAAAAAGDTLHLSVVRSGHGLEEYAQSGTTWSPEQTFSGNTSVLGTYLAGQPDGALRLGAINDLP